MLKVTNLRKEFDSVVAVNGVSLEVKRGELFGLLGPNGAGKTTTIRTVLNIIEPDAGQITFDGKPFTKAMWNIIGYLPEERGLYRKSKIINTILYFSGLKGLKPSEARPQILYWLERFGLKQDAHRKIEELSKGNQQKIQLIISLVHRPQLVILDEPFSGLDPVNQVLLKDVLMELRQKNVAIVFSTHQMDQVEKMCDNICLINQGKPVLNGSLSDIKKQHGTNSVHVEFEGDGEFLKSLPLVQHADVYQNYAELELADIARSNELFQQFDGKLAVHKFEIVEPSLNSIFINVVGGPEKIVHASAQPIPTSRIERLAEQVDQDPRVKKFVRSAMMLGVFTMGFLFYNLSIPEPTWYMPGIFFLGTIVSVVRWRMTKKRVEKELLAKQRQGEPV
ncbi:MAG TPA: ATP-binding cassette domain-containing protein [Bacteroidota bacterium]|nr:ATP-binding cassette domain-containing protein [Bacteroidota bacterium]